MRQYTCAQYDRAVKYLKDCTGPDGKDYDLVQTRQSVAELVVTQDGLRFEIDRLKRKLRKIQRAAEL